MKFTVEYPIERGGDYSADFLRPEVLTDLARTAEAAGFTAIGFSEHPAPSRKWRENGGHDTFDPLAALAFCAAVTTRLQLMPHLLVLPYHNPPMLAKTLSTVDVLSGGRLVVAAGTGYLRSEFAAVGSDFAERNALFDEAVEVVRAAWSGEPYHAEGGRFLAVDQVLRPRPVQARLPIWLGGNSALTRRRVVRYGDGWSPMLTADRSTATLRTSAIASIE
ncbi:TIGR03619 family F420-dependent LLM class oxidoreductase, partial [Pseudonocardia pini]|uniref:TIGR03619 family F420-dependent LLM class oxidoreductase n=1 Tax=Pseudonocardia pini TaxID=2758030 RepID=UPI0015F120DB